MRYRKLLTILVFAGLFAVCSLCTLTSWAMFSGINTNGVSIRAFELNNASAEVRESFQFEPVDTFIIDSDAGDVTISAGDVDQIEVEVVKTAWDGSESEARERAENLPLIVNESGSTIKFSFRQSDTLDFFTFGSGGSDHIDFIVHVPRDVKVDIRTGFGDVEADGMGAGTILSSSFGDVVAHDIDAGSDDVRLETSFGEIVLEMASAGEVRLETSNGDIQVRDLDASGSVTLDNSFGDITIRNLEAESLNVDKSNGEIVYSDGQIESKIDINNSFGRIELSAVDADGFKLQTSNGEIVVKGGGGGIMDLRSSFGSIRVENASNATLDIETSNGDVFFSGTLNPDQDHRLETSFGNIVMQLPENAALDINFDTSFGNISSDLPVSISGSLSDSSWDGRINDGGPELHASTSNGDISLRVYNLEN